MADVVAAGGATIVIAHSRAQPRTQLPQPHYDDVVAEVAAFLAERAAAGAGSWRARRPDRRSTPVTT